MFDTYRYYGRLEALVQIESARWKHSHLTTDVLLKKAEVLPKARGIKGFRALIEWSADSSASALETIVRDRILGAVESGRLQGVEKIEFQVGFQIMDEFGSPTTAWVDCIINDCIIVESDGAEKTSGAMGNAVAAVNSERHREKQLQNKGGVFFRVGWDSALAPGLIDQLQHVIDLHPGVRPMRGRLPVAYREWSKDMEWRFS